jgi:hypothetical protein
MAIREIKPLDTVQWAFVVKTINTEATPEQRKMMKEAIKDGSKVKTLR